MKTCLIDTGPLVAYLDRADPKHGAVAQALEEFSGQLVTTGAVITEAMHLLAEAPEGPESLAEFVEATGLRVVEMTQPDAVRRAAALMRKYRDTPMDFADATLVLLADELGVVEILTLDRRGFSTYRTAHRKRFQLVP
ncbi:MAG: PIN domain-containing protein [Acidobacteria bacterium]|nr:PIN domain-containing protein [Acidobacteriota bacterium]